MTWYERFRTEYTRALRFLSAYEVWQSRFHSNLLESFHGETLARFIFESNNLEKEGLSFVDTRELIFEEFGAQPKTPQPHPPSNLSNWENFFRKALSPDIKVGLIRHRGAQKKTQTQLIARYGKNRREVLTVIAHFFAPSRGENFANQNYASYVQLFYYYFFQAAIRNNDKKFKSAAKKMIAEFFPSGKKPVYKSLLNEKRIKELHAIMAKDLIPAKYAPGGHYRAHRIMTDFESHYPDPRDVPNAMKLYIKKFRALEHKVNPIFLAAWASTEFVKIHPFSDFNGRMSRLIMNMVLRGNGLFFYLSLKSNKKDRKRYITALRRYSRDKRLITTLISMQLNESFDEINRLSELSGKPLIDFEAIPPIPTDFTDSQLLSLELRPSLQVYLVTKENLQMPLWVPLNDIML